MPAGYKVLLNINFQCSLFDTEESTEIHVDDGGHTTAFDEDDLMEDGIDVDEELLQDDVY